MFSGVEFAKPGRDPDVVGRHIGEEDAALLLRALPDESHTYRELLREVLALLVPICRLESEHLLTRDTTSHRIEDAVLRRHEWRQLGQDHVRHCREVPLTLEQARKSLEVGLQPVLLRVDPRRLTKVADHLVQLVLEDGHFAACLNTDLTGEITFGHCGCDVRDRANLVGEICRQLVHVIGEILPDTSDFLGLRLASELPFHADFACNSRHLAGEAVELIHHRVDRVSQLEELAFDVRGDLAAEVAVRDSGGDISDISNLGREVVRHDVDVVGEILPDAPDLDRHCSRLTQLAFGTHLACDTRYLGDESVELVHHRVDGVLELEHLSLRVQRDLLAQVAICHSADDSLHLLGGPDEVIQQVVDGVHTSRPGITGSAEHHTLG